MARVETSDGFELHAEVHGEGVPLLFSCAYSTTHENWRAQVEPLVAAGARVILWDYLGHGKSDAPHDPSVYTMDRVVDDMGRVLAWGAKGEPAILCGLSFGGLTSLHFAASHLDQVRGLVLIAAGPGFKNPDAAAKWEARTNRTADYIERDGFRAFVDGKAGPTCIGRFPELPAAKAAADAMAAQDPVSVGLFARKVAALAPSVIDELKDIDRPALVVVGEEDPAFHQAADVMAAKLPNATKRIVPAGGHILNIETAEAFNATVAEFVGSLS
jgi:pimeloyl-ACP methyl ester carboxylesterase